MAFDATSGFLGEGPENTIHNFFSKRTASIKPTAKLSPPVEPDCRPQKVARRELPKSPMVAKATAPQSVPMSTTSG